MRTLLTLALLFGQVGVQSVIMTGPPGGPPANPPVLVQQKQATGGGITFTSNNTAGNTIVVFYAFGVGSTPNLSDTRGNTYTRIEQQNGGAALLAGYFVATSIAAGANTVSINTLGSGGVYIATEWSGVTGIEASQPTAANTGVGPITVGPINTTNANTLVLLYVAVQAAGTGSTTNTGGWTSIMNGGFGGQVDAGLFSFPAGIGSFSNTVNNVANSANNKFSGLLGLKGI